MLDQQEKNTWFAMGGSVFCLVDNPTPSPRMPPLVNLFSARFQNDNRIATQEELDMYARWASTAPEALRELQHLVRLIDPLLESGSITIPGLATMNAAKKVIAKAKGEQP